MKYTHIQYNIHWIFWCVLVSFFFRNLHAVYSVFFGWFFSFIFLISAVHFWYIYIFIPSIRPFAILLEAHPIITYVVHIWFNVSILNCCCFYSWLLLILISILISRAILCIDVCVFVFNVYSCKCFLILQTSFFTACYCCLWVSNVVLITIKF